MQSWDVQESNLAGVGHIDFTDRLASIASYRPVREVARNVEGPPGVRPGGPWSARREDELHKGSGRPILATDGELGDERHATHARGLSAFAGQARGPEQGNRVWQRIRAPALGRDGVAGSGMCGVGEHGVVLCCGAWLSRCGWRCDVRRRRSFHFSFRPSPFPVLRLSRPRSPEGSRDE